MKKMNKRSLYMKNKSLYSSSKSTWVLSLAVFKVEPTLLGETRSPSMVESPCVISLLAS
jgi:hypothetical protein